MFIYAILYYLYFEIFHKCVEICRLMIFERTSKILFFFFFLDKIFIARGFLIILCLFLPCLYILYNINQINFE